jgi:glycosyltransferase involved in cell wall biosynthesis
VEKITNEYSLPKRYILYEGSSRPSKNLRKMLRGFSILRKNRADLQDVECVLVLHGDAHKDEVKSLVRQLGLADKVHLLAEVSTENLKILYKKAQILMFVTKYEGFGFPILQAQAVGTPVLTSTSAALPEISRNSAILVDPDKEDEIAGGLVTLLTDKSRYDDLIQLGYENVKKYSWKNTASRVLEVYQHLA